MIVLRSRYVALGLFIFLLLISCSIIKVAAPPIKVEYPFGLLASATSGMVISDSRVNISIESDEVESKGFHHDISILGVFNLTNTKPHNASIVLGYPMYQANWSLLNRTAFNFECTIDGDSSCYITAKLETASSVFDLPDEWSWLDTQEWVGINVTLNKSASVFFSFSVQLEIFSWANYFEFHYLLRSQCKIGPTLSEIIKIDILNATRFLECGFEPKISFQESQFLDTKTGIWKFNESLPTHVSVTLWQYRYEPPGSYVPGIFGLCLLVMSLIALALLDRIGRRNIRA